MSQPVEPPRYQQVAAHLRERIRDGKLQAGDALPSEPALAAQFGMHRETVRKALATLREEGLIETRPKSRSRVRKILIPGPEVAEHVTAPREAASLLEIPDGTEVERRRQLHYLDGRPTQLSMIYFAPRVA